MVTYKNLELRDNIRNDALLLMKKKNISYLDAYEEAKKNLIGNTNVNDFEFKPLTTIINLDNNKSEDNYLNDLKKRLKDDIDVSKFNEEQLEEYVVAKEMGIDISSFADPGYNPLQIKYLVTQVLMGNSLEKYKNNYTFDPDREIAMTLIDG